MERAGGDVGFDGTLANVQVYPTALSAAEVASLYGSTGATAATIVRATLTTT